MVRWRKADREAPGVGVEVELETARGIGEVAVAGPGRGQVAEQPLARVEVAEAVWATQRRELK